MKAYEQQLTEIENLNKEIQYWERLIRIRKRKWVQEALHSAKTIQQAKKETLLMCAKGELEFLEDWTLPTFSDTPERKYHNDRINTRISQLQNVIKKLEEMK